MIDSINIWGLNKNELISAEMYKRLIQCAQDDLIIYTLTL
jgi:hypothetical protein